MKHEDIERLIYRIITTEDEEIDCNQLAELIAQYVDLEVSGKEAARVLPMVRQHLNQCDGCSEFHEVLYELALLEAQHELPEVDDLLDDILSGTAEPQVVRRPESFWSRVLLGSSRQPASVQGPAARSGRQRTKGQLAERTRWLPLGWVAAAAAMIIMISLGAWGWRLSGQLADLQRSLAFIAGADRAISMEGTDIDPDVRGFLIVNNTEERGLLIMQGIDPLPSDRVYQLWVMNESSDAVSMGIFPLGRSERSTTWVDLRGAPAQFASLAITAEPLGGSSTPSLTQVCVRGRQW